MAAGAAKDHAMSGRIELLRLLADGALHSGEELAAALSISRAAVWKRLQQLEEWGIAFEAKAGSGYRLESPLDLLDAAAIRSRLPPAAVERLRNLEVLESLDSTSNRLLRPTTCRRGVSTPASRNSRPPGAAAADGTGSRPSHPGFACRSTGAIAMHRPRSAHCPSPRASPRCGRCADSGSRNSRSSGRTTSSTARASSAAS